MLLVLSCIISHVAYLLANDGVVAVNVIIQDFLVSRRIFSFSYVKVACMRNEAMVHGA